jgi:tRNA(fMet)-specific endonuclease VapC
MQRKIEELPNLDIATCVIVCNELIYGALKSEQANENLIRIKTFLQTMPIYLIDEETAEFCAELKLAILNQFGPQSKQKRRNTKIESLGFKDNDLWICAIAIQYSLILVSSDSDVKRLNGICGLSVEDW